VEAIFTKLARRGPGIMWIAALSILGACRAEPLSVCEVLDRSGELNGRTITVRGFLEGSPQHGYSLFAYPGGRSDPCPGWRESVLTAPAIVELGAEVPGTAGGDEYHKIVLEMDRKYVARDFTPVEVEVEGRLERKWFLFINRQPGGGYVGNGFGEKGGRAAILHIKSVRKVFARP
jgi:hypothetical protein